MSLSRTLEGLFELTRRPLRAPPLPSCVASRAIEIHYTVRARFRSPRTLSRTIDTNLDSVFLENTLVFVVLNIRDPRLSLATLCDPPACFFRFIVSRRVFVLVGLHYYYRALTMFVTDLPEPRLHHKCANKTETPSAGLLTFTLFSNLSHQGVGWS